MILKGKQQWNEKSEECNVFLFWEIIEKQRKKEQNIGKKETEKKVEEKNEPPQIRKFKIAIRTRCDTTDQNKKNIIEIELVLDVTKRTHQKQ